MYNNIQIMSDQAQGRKWCDCTAKCLGGRFIGRSTWFKHAKYRRTHTIPGYMPGDEEYQGAAGPSPQDTDFQMHDAGHDHEDYFLDKDGPQTPVSLYCF
jgi:hypothetical protein